MFLRITLNQQWNCLSKYTFKEKAMKRIIEIRAAEGGDDSKLFVQDLAQAYKKFAERKG